VALSTRREGAKPTEPPIADLVQIVVDGPPAVVGEPPAVGATPPQGPAGKGEAAARLRGPAGKSHGEIHLRETAAGLLIRASLHDLPAGTHAFHLHETGLCESSFESAGEHLAPGGRSHGFLAAGGPHAGDLVNLEVGSDGRVQQELRAPDLSLAEVLDADGAAFIVHERADDYSTQPSGGAGGRIACAIVERPTVSASTP
jgi:Cu-Zn family superoxide dismutase